MSDRPRHPNPAVERAVRYAEANNWTVVIRSGHCWALVRCPGGSGGCQLSVYSTPQNPGNHAKRLIRIIDQCPH